MRVYDVQMYVNVRSVLSSGSWVC